MFRNFELTFTPKTSEFVKSQYNQATTILEYGAGGSTLLAAELGKNIISTESSSEWMIELMGAYKELNYSGNIIPIYSDIGPTKSLGYPKDSSKWRNWPNYATRAWHYCKEHNIDPDLVLVDGRFRVSCFLASCIHIRKPTRILFDDFVDRPHYHLVKEIATQSETIDNRLAVFDVEPGGIDPEWMLDNIQYFFKAE